MTVLYCDPSARAFGAVLMEDEELVGGWCIDFIGKSDGSAADICRVITKGLSDWLAVIDKNHKLDMIVSELPIGSQSLKVAWYLSAVQSTIIAFARSRDITNVGYKQGVVKKIVHGRHNKVTKKDTINFVFDKLPKFSYILRGNQDVQSAIADALAVYYCHKEKNVEKEVS